MEDSANQNTNSTTYDYAQELYYQELEDFFENAPIPLHWVNHDGYIIRANQAELRLLGYCREEYVGQHITQFHADQTAIAELIQRLCANETLHNFRATLRCKDGSIKQVLIDSNVYWRNGEFCHTRCFTRDVTQETLLQLEAETARHQVTNILESITDAFFALDTQWKFTYVNRQAVQLLQRSAEELMGRCIWEEFPDAIDTIFDQEYHRAVRDRVSVEFEAFYPPLNGWFEVRAYPSREGLSVYFQNITQRKQTEAALHESEERWQLALRGNNDGIWDWNLLTNQLFFSPRWKEMLGYEDHEVSTSLEEWEARIHPDDYDPILQATRDHLSGKTPFYSAEYRMRCKDGTYKWILDRGQALWNESGQAIRMVGSHTDITDRKLADVQLQQQTLKAQLFAEVTLRLRQSLQAEEILQTAVVEVQKMLQADRVILFRVWEDGSGTVMQEAVLPEYSAVLGKRLFDPCFSLDYQEKYRQGYVSAIADIDTANIQDCHRDFLQQFEVRANLVVPILLKEEFWGLLIAHQCQHPRQWNDFETELLKQLADQIGIALAQARMLEQETRQRQKLAQSNAELEQFAYVASHDLQEPLRMVTSYLQLLHRRYKHQLDQQADEFIDFAIDGTNRMQTLIQDLLSFSRVSTRGKEFSPVDCNLVVDQAIANLKIAIEESNAVITHMPLPTVMGDITQLVQLLQNLIGNAIKFRGEHDLKIHIGVDRVLKTTDNKFALIYSPPSQTPLNTTTSGISSDWRFFVRDNGIGIDPTFRDRIFIIFQRLHTRTKYPGNGIGLAICKKIIERHGGQIWVESEPGQGATFFFTLPEVGNVL
jgi:hypothetical protein